MAASFFTSWAGKQLVRSLAQQVTRELSTDDLLTALRSEAEETPRSLNGCDRLLMPRILKDFPDFDTVMAKTYIREFLAQKFGSNDGFSVHNVVIARYLPSAVQKTIVFQASVSWMEQKKRIQKRFDLNYTYLVASSDAHVAANCPNCGSPLHYGDTICAYCDSRVVGVLGNTWKITQVTET